MSRDIGHTLLGLGQRFRRSSRRPSPEGEVVAAIAGRVSSGGGRTVRGCPVPVLLFSRSCPSRLPLVRSLPVAPVAPPARVRAGRYSYNGFPCPGLPGLPGLTGKGDGAPSVT